MSNDVENAIIETESTLVSLFAGTLVDADVFISDIITPHNMI